jgi:hypothetical protein
MQLHRIAVYSEFGNSFFRRIGYRSSRRHSTAHGSPSDERTAKDEQAVGGVVDHGPVDPSALDGGGDTGHQCWHVDTH